MGQRIPNHQKGKNMIVGPYQLNHLIQYHGLITPFEAEQVKTDSVDTRVQAIYRHQGGAVLMTDEEQVFVGEMDEIKPKNGVWTLNASGYYIGQTVEEVHMPDNMAAVAVGRSTVFRAGIVI